jgi:hypothetical protein
MIDGVTDDTSARVARIRRAFDAAFRRMCAASNVEDGEDELSNLLCQMYRLHELVEKTLGQKDIRDSLVTTPERRTARAAIWARTFDTHDAAVVADPDDLFSDYFTNLHGVLVWRPADKLPKQVDNYDRHVDYADYLAGRPVLDTARRAFDALAAMLPGA